MGNCCQSSVNNFQEINYYNKRHLHINRKNNRLKNVLHEKLQENNNANIISLSSKKNDSKIMIKSYIKNKCSPIVKKCNSFYDSELTLNKKNYFNYNNGIINLYEEYLEKLKIVYNKLDIIKINTIGLNQLWNMYKYSLNNNNFLNNYLLIDNRDKIQRNENFLNYFRILNYSIKDILMLNKTITNQIKLLEIIKEIKELIFKKNIIVIVSINEIEIIKELINFSIDNSFYFNLYVLNIDLNYNKIATSYNLNNYSNATEEAFINNLNSNKQIRNFNNRFESYLSLDKLDNSLKPISNKINNKNFKSNNLIDNSTNTFDISFINKSMLEDSFNNKFMLENLDLFEFIQFPYILINLKNYAVNSNKALFFDYMLDKGNSTFVKYLYSNKYNQHSLNYKKMSKNKFFRFNNFYKIKCVYEIYYNSYEENFNLEKNRKKVNNKAIITKQSFNIKSIDDIIFNINVILQNINAMYNITSKNKSIYLLLDKTIPIKTQIYLMVIIVYKLTNMDYNKFFNQFIMSIYYIGFCLENIQNLKLE